MALMVVLNAGEKKITVNFTKGNKSFSLSVHYNGDTSYLFVNETRVCKFNAHISLGMSFVEEASQKVLQKINWIRFLQMAMFIVPQLIVFQME